MSCFTVRFQLFVFTRLVFESYSSSIWFASQDVPIQSLADLSFPSVISSSPRRVLRLFKVVVKAKCWLELRATKIEVVASAGRIHTPAS